MFDESNSFLSKEVVNDDIVDEGQKDENLIALNNDAQFDDESQDTSLETSQKIHIMMDQSKIYPKNGYMQKVIQKISFLEILHKVCNLDLHLRILQIVPLCY